MPSAALPPATPPPTTSPRRGARDALTVSRGVEVLRRGPVDHVPVEVVARAVARAVPRAFGLVPVDRAAHVGAPRRGRVEHALFVEVCGHGAPAVQDDAARAR